MVTQYYSRAKRGVLPFESGPLVLLLLRITAVKKSLAVNLFMEDQRRMRVKAVYSTAMKGACKQITISGAREFTSCPSSDVI